MAAIASAARSIVRIPVGSVGLEAAFEAPGSARGIVLFAHGSGSSRMSPRNRFVAAELRQAGFATVLTDLLTEAEDEVGERRFDIGLLAERLRAAVFRVLGDSRAAGLPLGLFGASTGAAAALEVAADMGTTIAAVVSRGGRPDLARPGFLERVACPTLLIVGANDPVVVTLNERAAQRLAGPHAIRVIPGASHLFPEPGALETVAALASDWFHRHLARKAASP